MADSQHMNMCKSGVSNSSQKVKPDMSQPVEKDSVAAVTDAVSDDPSTTNDRPQANANPSKDRSFFSWFDKNDGLVERRLILKLDFLTLSFACMGFWVCLHPSMLLPSSLLIPHRSCTLTGVFLPTPMSAA